MTDVVRTLRLLRKAWAAHWLPVYGIVGGPPGPVRPSAPPRVVDVAAHGLAAAGLIRADRPGPDEGHELLAEVAARGDWRAAADALAGLGDDWERRYDAQIVLARGAADDDRWLDSWIASSPSDGTGLAIRAQMLLELVGDGFGGPAFAPGTVTRSETIREVLRQVTPLWRRAAELRPQDPTALITGMSAATVLGVSRDEFTLLWNDVRERDPLHVGAHRVALIHWSSGRRGDLETCEAFVEEALAGAPSGSLLSMLRLLMYEREEAFVRTEGRRVGFGRRKVGAAVDAALADLAAADPGHVRIAEMRHLLAHHLTGLGRYDEAVEQFRRLGAWCGADPWWEKTDPVAAFVRCRAEAVAGLGNARLIHL